MKTRLVLALIGSVLPGPVKRAFLRFALGARIEEGAVIGFGTVIWANTISIGRDTIIGRFNRIRAHSFRADSFVTIGSFTRISVHTCHLHSRVTINSNATLSGDPADARSVLQMGMHSWVFQDCYIDVARPVTMGRNVGVGGGTYIFTHGFWLSKLHGFPVGFGPVTIGDDVWLPWGCFILPGVTVGSGVVLGARAVVNKDVPPHALVGGIPAKVLRERSNRNVDHLERMQMLEEVTTDFAAYKCRLFQRHEREEWIDLEVGGSNVVRLHRMQPTSRSAISETALNILPLAPDLSMDKAAWLALSDFRSSTYRSFSLPIREWLQHARNIGLRFYPIDEVAQYRSQDGAEPL